MTVTKPKVWILQAIYPDIIDSALDVFERQFGIHPALLKLDNVLLSQHFADATPARSAP